MTTKGAVMYLVGGLIVYLMIKFAYDKGRKDASTTTTIAPAGSEQRQKCPDGQCWKTKTVGDITYSGCGPCNSASI